MKSYLAIATLPLALVAPALSYTWPDPKVDEMEDIMYLTSGYGSRGFKDSVTPCTAGLSPSRNTAAEWLRVAFHDASTYNAAEGTGGIDASIMWESDFPPNNGIAFNSTFQTMQKFYTVRSSMADMFALSAYTAVRACGGPSVPIRFGRVDATNAGPNLGPVPVDSTNDLVTKFKRQGWTIPDMIKLTACGHTFGGVHGEDFPQIVGNSSNLYNVHFDTTIGGFDNKIVTQYLTDNTTNSLVNGPDTTNSDLRTFTSDGNVTMKALADPKHFQEACLDVFTRMLDRVPKTVQLSDVVKPIEVKPSNVQLTLNKDGSVQFSGVIRVHNKPSVSSSSNASKRAVSVNYFDRSGASCNSCTVAATHVGSGAGLDDTFEFYSFSTKLPKNGLSKFNVVVDRVVYNNGGDGFPKEDTVIYQAPLSCITKSSSGAYSLTVTAAALGDNFSSAHPAVSLNLVHKTPQAGNHSTVAPHLSYEPHVMQLKSSNVAGSGYSLFSVTTSLSGDQIPTTFDVVGTTGDKRVTDDFHSTTTLPTACEAHGFE